MAKTGNPQMRREDTPIPLKGVERQVVLETLRRLHPNYDTNMPIHAIGSCYVVEDDGFELHLAIKGPKKMKLRFQTNLPEEYVRQRGLDKGEGFGSAVLYFEDGKPGLELIGLSREELDRRSRKR
jgi:hypothetical protein